MVYDGVVSKKIFISSEVDTDLWKVNMNLNKSKGEFMFKIEMNTNIISNDSWDIFSIKNISMNKNLKQKMKPKIGVIIMSKDKKEMA